MARAKSIGSLFIDVEARTAKLEEDMGRVRKIVEQGKASVASQGEEWAKLDKANSRFATQLTSRMAGAISLFSLMKREIAFVSANIDKIPGISPMTIASVKEMNSNLTEFRYNVDGMVAGLMSKFANFGKAVGMGFAAIQESGGNWGDPNKMHRILAEYQEPRESNDETAQKEDLHFQDKVLAKMIEIGEARKRLAQAGMTEVELIKTLRGEAQKWDVFANNRTFNSLDRASAQLTAIHKQEQAESKMQTLREKLLEQEKRVQSSLEDTNKAHLSVNEQVEAYTNKVWELRQALQSINAVMKDDPNNPQFLQTEVDRTKELADAQEKLNAALKKQGELGAQVGQAIANNFGDAILRGEGLHNMLNAILQDILKIVLQRSIIGPLADMLGGGLTSLFTGGGVGGGFGAISFGRGGGGGMASGGPLGPGARLVGEHGPEILATSGYGTIIPNDKLRGGGGGNRFYIDATGADMAAIQRLESALQRLAGPGQVERRAVSAVIGTKWRRGSAGNNL